MEFFVSDPEKGFSLIAEICVVFLELQTFHWKVFPRLR